MLKINAKVIPNSSSNKIIMLDYSSIKQSESESESEFDFNIRIKVMECAVNGQANNAVINLLSTHFSVKKSNIVILSGHTSQRKIIGIHNTDKSVLQFNTQLKLL